VNGCALSADGVTAVSASSDHTLRVWDVGSEGCRAVLVVEAIQCCAITADGRQVLTGDGAGHVHLFEWIEP
jgi:WD40 repeat protein